MASLDAEFVAPAGGNRLARALAVVSLAIAAVLLAGWSITVTVAVFLPGGHPPLSAYYGAVMLLATGLAAPVGILLGLAAIVAQRRPTLLPLLGVVVNSGLLVFCILG